MDEWRSEGWELVSETRVGRRRSEMVFRRVKPSRPWMARAGLGLFLILGLLLTLAPAQTHTDPLRWVRAAAAGAVQALEERDLFAVDRYLAAHRGNPDFAYFFASETTPRTLGDALAAVAGTSDAPFTEGVDPHEYDLALTDLAGTLALATHGTGGRALPPSWAEDFAAATTVPETLYGESSDDSTERRADQDVANKQNLLLLLSRGYWSTEFLQTVTAAYWRFDREEHDDAWPGPVLEDARYAPAPTGDYLTDGMLALTAALTANSNASEWAFTDFQPGTETIEGSDYEVGKFTHYLLFEHEFPESSDDESIGMTAVLTALSSAIDTSPVDASSSDAGPMRDSLVLQELADELTKDSGCSWNPRDYWNCAKAAADAVWAWIRNWGHLVLDILTLATFAPPPFRAIGMAAATTNATWYAIEGDYGMAGLSLAAAMPGLAFSKFAKGAAATKADDVANVARRWRPRKPWMDCDLLPQRGIRIRYDERWTRAQRTAADEKIKAIWEAAQRGELRKTLSRRATTSASARYRAAGGKVPDGQDVDHTIELQLGGTDDISNMKPLDSAVNRSLGKQIEAQLRDLDYGAAILGAAIC